MTTSPELYYTALVALFTGLMWVPIILNRLMEMGILSAINNPEPDSHPTAKWAYRLDSAHRNAIENLVVFAPLAIMVHVAQLGSGATALAALIFFGARVAHAVIYTFGIPLLRTIAFVTGFACQVFLAGVLLGLF